ncbi:MAG: hypothetical protein WA888_04945 [Burkholderiaceae bacterium]
MSILRHRVAIACKVLLIASLAACGGGGDTEVGRDRTDPVVSGFTASSSFVSTKLPDFVEADSSPLGVGGGRSSTNVLGCPFETVPLLPLPAASAVGNGTNGVGGIGIGGAPGRFQNVEITVTEPDATEIGRATVDSASGMVTDYPGEDYTGGLIVTVRGTATGLVWDPSSDSYKPFTAQDSWRAYVDGIRGNIAVSPLTEAAARLVDSSGAPKTAAAFRDANQLVAQQVNRCLPAAFRVRDITRLPDHVLSEASVNTSVTDEFSGRQTIAIAGMIKSFDNAVAGITGVVVQVFQNYLAVDLSDGILDGQVAGQPIPSANAPGGAFIQDTTFFSNVKWGIDQTWFKYRDPAYAPLLNSQEATYDCYEYVNGVSVGGVDANNNPITTRTGVMRYFPVTNGFQFDGGFEFSAPFRSVKEGPDQFGRNQQKELIGGVSVTDAAGVTTIWEAKRTVTYVPSFYKKKIVQADLSSTEIQCYGPEPVVIVVPDDDEREIVDPISIVTDPDLRDGF